MIVLDYSPKLVLVISNIISLQHMFYHCFLCVQVFVFFCIKRYYEIRVNECTNCRRINLLWYCNG